MKLYSKILLSAIGALALSGCHSAIMSDLTECPQYTVFTFDVRTPDEISFPDNKIDEAETWMRVSANILQWNHVTRNERLK